MTAYQLALMPGDGIGPELMAACRAVLATLGGGEDGPTFAFDEVPIGYAHWRATGAEVERNGRRYGGIDERALLRAVSADAVLYIAVASADFPREVMTPHPLLRQHLGIFANARPCKAYAGVPALAPAADFVLLREQTEGFWHAPEFHLRPGLACAVVSVSDEASERLAHTACRLALTRRRRVTCVHKANASKLVYGTFLDACRRVTAGYPEVEFRELHTDILPYVMIAQPAELDVVVMTNFYGDALSGAGAALVGGLGLCPSAEYGPRHAIFRPVHGSAPDIAGRGIANPIAALLSVRLMLDWLGSTRGDGACVQAAFELERAVAAVLAEGRVRTPDLGGSGTTTDLTDAVIARLDRARDRSTTP